MTAKTVLLLVVCLGVFGCGSERYELATDEAGHVIRLDRQTGSMVSIKDGIGTPILTFNEGEEDPEFPFGSWTASIKGVDDSAVLSGRWNDGILDYILTINPIPEDYPVSGQAQVFDANLDDGLGFLILNIPIYRQDITSIVDENGERQSLSLKASIACTRSQFERAKTGRFRVGWLF